MKILALFLFVLISCSQKTVVGPSLPKLPTSALDQDFSFLKECSQIRAINQTTWLLTCQKAPHADRTEIYEWSNDSQKLKRLTYQDGQIWDIMPIDSKSFYYSSSYDEFKEQFASILNGAKPGSDIYYKKRAESEFERLTDMKGLEFSFSLDSSHDLLYFVHEGEKASEIMTLNVRDKINQLYSSKKTLRNPTYMENSKKLYWLEFDSADKGPILKVMDKKKKIKDLYKSESKVFQLAAGPKSEQLLFGFVVGTGIEIWNLGLTDNCWKLAYKSPDPVSEFYALNDKTIFLTVKNSLKKDSFFSLPDTCVSVPPNLGVSAL